ncbi:MAG TPA: single-stranded-DNA-specific exonuclease RecJ [Candidatus Hypogeohydataceae bacterium YC41]
MEKRWITKSTDEKLQAHLSNALKISPILAHLLINRGVTDPHSAHSFLQPKLSGLSDPMLMPEMEKAALRIASAVSKKEKIVIYGDYDVDGVTGTALLFQCLSLLGADVHYYIPERIQEGYGLNIQAIRGLAEKGTRVLVTVDCGINSILEADEAKKNGLDLIITDHHQPSKDLPRAYAVINPKLPGPPQACFKDLSGVGVAFKLAWALGMVAGGKKRVSTQYKEFLLNAMGLAALGTIADSVPLVGENRILASYGLTALRQSTHPGIKALLEKTDLEGLSISSNHVEFRLGPRLNAAGRLEDARLSVELLVTQCPQRAAEIASQLEEKNRRRQNIQAQILQSAREMIEKEVNLDSAGILVLAGEGWHPGVIGIVASRLMEEYHRPTIIIALRGEVGYGSGRSIPNFNLVEALEASKGRLLKFGGHALAAGFRIKREEIEGFRDQINRSASTILKREYLKPTLITDGELSFGKISVPLIKEFGHLCPHGEGNPEPLFTAEELSVAGEPIRLGSSGQHLSLFLRQGKVSFRAIGFGMGTLLSKIEKVRTLSAAFRPKLSKWKDEAIELEIEDIGVES